VYLPPLAGETAADKRAAELRARDEDCSSSTAARNALRSRLECSDEDAANVHCQSRSRASPARRPVQAAGLVQTVLVIRDPQQPVSRGCAISARVSRAEVKIGGCDKAGGRGDSQCHDAG
jgi:hypothetical protein